MPSFIWVENEPKPPTQGLASSLQIQCHIHQLQKIFVNQLNLKGYMRCVINYNQQKQTFGN